jgi:hypothetical protein
MEGEGIARTILNSETIPQIEENMSFVMKPARNNYTNYIIHPNIAVKLFNPKVSWIDPTGKNLCLCFNKYEYLSLLTMLKNINRVINYKFKSKYHKECNVSLFYERNDVFYIKCFLPNSGVNKGIGKYNILFHNDSDDTTFKLPLVGCIYKSVIIDIRNIWMNSDSCGINLELKEAEF